ncbi:DUF3159 domain-containing protein [Micromonospora maritima]|uniref:DUF3159 domain-containing protein n=1 Tax=Micromonospora maritima TaxID=986711 RepID=UPI001C2D65C5|nr:DUF3159 domain-containing protein [Micromonospora maritima]
MRWPHAHRGRLEEPERAANGYKRYGIRHLVRLLRIRRLVDLGVSLADTAVAQESVEGAEQTFRALDVELAASIERQQRIRAELAAILRQMGGPAGFVYSTVPVIVFVTADAFLPLPAAVGVAVATGLALSVVRWLRGARLVAAAPDRARSTGARRSVPSVSQAVRTAGGGCAAGRPTAPGCRAPPGPC